MNNHDHCKNCFKLDCKDIFCKIMYCTRECGFRFHICKYQEHELLCPLKLIICINSFYGCAQYLKRCLMSRHLETCPASVVSCTMKWNRWAVKPLECETKKGQLSPPNPLSYANYTQLDLALAIRDQKLLYQSYRFFKESQTYNINMKRKILPQFIYPCYKNTPISCENKTLLFKNVFSDQICNNIHQSIYDKRSSSGDTATSNDSETPWEIVKHPPGLKLSICDKLFTNKSSYQKNKNDHSIKINNLLIQSRDMSATITFNSKVDAENPKICKNIKQTSFLENSCYDKEELCTLKKEVIAPTCLNDLLSINMDTIHAPERKSKSLYTFLCGEQLRRDQYSSHFRDIHYFIHSEVNGWIERRCLHAEYGCTFSIRRMNPQNSRLVFDCDKNNLKLCPYNKEENMLNYSNSEYNFFNIATSRNLEAKLKLNKYKDNVFLSKNEGYLENKNLFKKNSHLILEDLTRMNNTILKEDISYHDKDQKIIFCNPTKCNTVDIFLTQVDDTFNILEEIPVDVILHVLNYLDSSSLNSLALVSKSMRNLCSCLLSKRGVVVLQWQKTKIDCKIHWNISHHRWFFTNHFTPIKNWTFENENEYRNHLSNCSYNAPISYTSHKVPLCGMVFNLDEFKKRISKTTTKFSS